MVQGPPVRNQQYPQTVIQRNHQRSQVRHVIDFEAPFQTMFLATAGAAVGLFVAGVFILILQMLGVFGFILAASVG